MSPADQITPEKIFQTATGLMGAKFLFAAGEIRLFEALAEGPLGMDEIAQRRGVTERTARMVADAMVALDYLERDGSRYRNGPVASAFLTGLGPGDFRPFLRFWDRISYKKWVRLAESVSHSSS